MTAKINKANLWRDNQGRFYQIIHTVVDDTGQEWVHYRRDLDSHEFSCWIDSFLIRFTEHTR